MTTTNAAQLSAQLSTYHTTLIRFANHSHDFQRTANAHTTSPRLNNSLTSLWQACDAMHRARAEYAQARASLASFING